MGKCKSRKPLSVGDVLFFCESFHHALKAARILWVSASLNEYVRFSLTASRFIY